MTDGLPVCSNCKRKIARPCAAGQSCFMKARPGRRVAAKNKRRIEYRNLDFRLWVTQPKRPH